MREARVRAAALLAAAATTALLSTLLAVSATPAAAEVAPDTTWESPGLAVWRHSGRLDQLDALPAPARAFVRDRLDQMWEAAGSRTACEHSATVVVRRYSPLGYLRVTREGMAAHGGDPDSCTGTGRLAIYADWSGSWRRIAATTGTRFRCQVLVDHDVPGAIGGRTCTTSTLKTAEYEPPMLRTKPKAVVRHLRTAVNEGRWDDALNWANQDAIDSMQFWWDQGYRYGRIYDGCEKPEDQMYYCSMRVLDNHDAVVGSAFLDLSPLEDLIVTRAGVAVIG